MDIVIHRIRVREGIDPARFVDWVRTVDYANCPALPSVRRFDVAQVCGSSADFVEVISVTDRSAFARDMGTPMFNRLESEFEQLAEVVDEIDATRVDPGYAAAPVGVEVTAR